MGGPSAGSWFTIDGLSFYSWDTEELVLQFIDTQDAEEAWDVMTDPREVLISQDRLWDIWVYEHWPTGNVEPWTWRYINAPPEDTLD